MNYFTNQKLRFNGYNEHNRNYDCFGWWLPDLLSDVIHPPIGSSELLTSEEYDSGVCLDKPPLVSDESLTSGSEWEKSDINPKAPGFDNNNISENRVFEQDNDKHEELSETTSLNSGISTESLSKYNLRIGISEFVSKSENQDKSVISSEHQDKSVISREHRDKPVISRERQDKSVISSERQDKSIICRESQNKSVISRERQDKFVISSEHQDTSIISREHRDKSVISREHQDKSVISNEHQDKSVISSDHQDKSVISREQLITLINLDLPNSKQLENILRNVSNALPACSVMNTSIPVTTKKTQNSLVKKDLGGRGEQMKELVHSAEHEDGDEDLCESRALFLKAATGLDARLRDLAADTRLLYGELHNLQHEFQVSSLFRFF